MAALDILKQHLHVLGFMHRSLALEEIRDLRQSFISTDHNFGAVIQFGVPVPDLERTPTGNIPLDIVSVRAWECDKVVYFNAVLPFGSEDESRVSATINECTLRPEIAGRFYASADANYYHWGQVIICQGEAKGNVREHTLAKLAKLTAKELVTHALAKCVLDIAIFYMVFAKTP